MKSPFIHLILTGITCAIVLIGYGIWYAAISAKSTAVAVLQNQIDTKTETVKRANTTRAALAEIAGDEAVVQGYFVPETGVVAFIDGLEAYGRAQGASVTVLSVSAAQASARPALEFALTIIGTFDAVLRTAGAIEYAPYNISVSTFTVGRDEEKKLWHADLKLLVGSVSAVAATHTP